MKWDRKKRAAKNYSMIAHFYNHLMRHVNYPRWHYYISSLLQKYGKTPGNMLEIACGTGIMLEKFSRDGWQVYGFDSSPSMIKQATQRLSGHIDSPNLWVGDMTQSATAASFDVVLCLYDSVNYCLSEERLLNAFKNMVKNVKRNGLLIFDVCTVNNCMCNFRDYYEKEFYKKYDYTRYASFDPVSHFQTNEFEVISSDNDQVVFYEKHVQKIYRLEVVEEVLKQSCSSIEIVGVYENYSRRPGTEKSDRVHFVVRKT